MKNHETRPTSSNPFPRSGRGRNRKYDHRYTQNKFGTYDRNYRNNNSSSKDINGHQKLTKIKVT